MLKNWTYYIKIVRILSSSWWVECKRQMSLSPGPHMSCQFFLSVLCMRCLMFYHPMFVLVTKFPWLTNCKIALPQSHHPQEVAQAMQSTMLGESSPVLEVVLQELHPTSAATTFFFTASGPPTQWSNYKCTSLFLVQDVAMLELNDPREKPLDEVVVKWSEYTADEKRHCCEPV